MRVSIIGGSGGIGASLISQLLENEAITEIQATYHQREVLPELTSKAASAAVHLTWSQLDVTSEPSVKNWCSELGGMDWLINCVGFLHSDSLKPEKSISQFDPNGFEQSMTVNCLPTLLLAKHAQALLKRSKRPIFATVSARVGSIEDNYLGGWHSYRASKAALNMSLKCIAIEWQSTIPSARVLALHPGTTDTHLSKPFQRRLPEGKLFSTEKTASYLLQRIEEAHEHESGRFIAWDGQTIPW